MTGTKISDRSPPTSDWLDSDLYTQLDTEHSRDRSSPDAQGEQTAVGAILLMEARLLDERRFEEWLGLFTQACIYWVPASNPPGPSASSVSNTLDDRRRLEDRVFRYATGYAYSQLPLSRMSRTLSLPECWWLERNRRLLARTAFQISELRRGEINLYAGHYDHVLQLEDGNLLIERKVVHLLGADEPLKNISFIF